MNTHSTPRQYLHTVHRPHGTMCRLVVGDCILDFTIGQPNSMSRRNARLIAARHRHAENVFQSRKAAFVRAGHSDFTAEVLACNGESQP